MKQKDERTSWWESSRSLLVCRITVYLNDFASEETTVQKWSRSPGPARCVPSPLKGPNVVKYRAAARCQWGSGFGMLAGPLKGEIRKSWENEN